MKLKIEVFAQHVQAEISFTLYDWNTADRVKDRIWFNKMFNDSHDIYFYEFRDNAIKRNNHWCKKKQGTSSIRTFVTSKLLQIGRSIRRLRVTTGGLHGSEAVADHMPLLKMVTFPFYEVFSSGTYYIWRCRRHVSLWRFNIVTS